MVKILNFKSKDNAILDEEGEVEECPMMESLQNVLRDFHDLMIKKVGCKPPQEEGDPASEMLVAMEMDASWVDKLATFVVRS